jgi:tetratricopeptide (TPR) repeat protein
VYYAAKKQVGDALPYFEKAASVNPFFCNHHANLGTAYFNLGRLDEALAQFCWAAKLQPDNPAFGKNLSTILYRQGKIAEALAERRKVIELCPNDVYLLNDTAWLLATSPDASIRNGQEAVTLAERAVKFSNGEEPAVLATLAAAYAEGGRFAEAVKTARKALELAKRKNRTALAESIQAKLSLYEAGTPFRETSRPSAGTPSPH